MHCMLDIEALLTCMIYVDLNPIRADICDSLDGSNFTSVQERLFTLVKNHQNILMRKK